MAHDFGAHCHCVSEHRPPVLEYDLHHIHPLGMGGPDDPSNEVWVCPTTHRNIHELLRLMVRNGPLSYRQCQQLEDRPVSRYAWEIARQGYVLWRESTTEGTT